MPRASKAASAPVLPDSFNDLRLTRDGKLMTPDGVVDLKKIGKGMFSTVYAEQGPGGRVFAMTDPGSFDKEILASAHDDNPGNPHLPAVEKFGLLTDDRQVFVMPRYAVPYRVGSATPADAKAFTAIRACIQALPPFDPKGRTSAYQDSCAKVDCVRGKGLPPAMVEALEAIVETSANYGDSFALEFSPRNVATDTQGRLVFLDLLFDRDLMAKKRATKANARGGFRANPSSETKLSPGQRRRTPVPPTDHDHEHHEQAWGATSRPASSRPVSRTNMARYKDLFGEEDARDWSEAFRYADGFDIADVADVVSHYAQDGTYIAVMLLHDGRWAWLRAGHCNSGWGCQEGGRSATSDSLIDLMRENADEEDADLLKMEMPPHTPTRSERGDWVIGIYGNEMPLAARITNDLVRTLRGSHPDLADFIDLQKTDRALRRGERFKGVDVIYTGGDQQLLKLMRDFYKADLARANKKKPGLRWRA